MKPTATAIDATGVGDTLEWLKRVDKDARNDLDRVTREMNAVRVERLKNLPKDDGKDWDKEIRFLQDDLDYYGKVSEKYRNDLLKYELRVVPEKREAGESIKQAEGARLIEMTVTHIRFGVEQLKLVIAQSLPLCKTESEALAVINPLLSTCISSALDNAIQESQLPKWCVDAGKAGL